MTTAGPGNWQVDLTDPTRILTVKADVSDQKVIDALKKAGYKARRLVISVDDFVKFFTFVVLMKFITIHILHLVSPARAHFFEQLHG
jgi:hypothetical protein